MNRNHEQRARRLAARIAALAVITLAPLAVTAGPALAGPAAAVQVSDSHDSSDSFGDSSNWNDSGRNDNDHHAWDNDDDDFGWDDNGHYGYKDHHRQDYDGWEDHLNSGDNQYPDRDSHNNRGRDYDQPADWDHENPRGGGGAPPNWNVPNPYIPPPPPSLLPQVQLPVLPQLPFALPGIPGLPGTGSAR
ncbi:hypothetical protein [Nocardia jinanensis]|uniref:Uncharacterized protein n=1 Tax=Nocardia jinanensis TaxID=382504 RepID=A0A917RX08_9NOCA|nr:hypothetical protein [Nocardia jinanensis]GGL38275.1 hypothetical protein GCM10011588_61070 [Nocardia jinanensis]